MDTRYDLDSVQSTLAPFAKTRSPPGKGTLADLHVHVQVYVHVRVRVRVHVHVCVAHRVLLRGESDHVAPRSGDEATVGHDGVRAHDDLVGIRVRVRVGVRVRVMGLGLGLGLWG